MARRVGRAIYFSGFEALSNDFWCPISVTYAKFLSLRHKSAGDRFGDQPLFRGGPGDEMEIAAINEFLKSDVLAIPTVF